MAGKPPSTLPAWTPWWSGNEAGWEPTSLAGFFSGLAAEWRGWDGVRSWQSEAAELRLTARHDKRNTVLVTVELEDGAPPRWRCEAELELDSGVLDRLAGDARTPSAPPLA